MRSSTPTGRDGFLPILLANLLPLAGVVVLEWDPATLVCVYGLELFVTLLLAGGKALFAQQPPPADREGVLTVSDAALVDKRGSVRPFDWLPPVYPRNVPFVLAVVGAVAMYLVFFGVVVVAIFDGDPGPTRPAVLGSVVALAIGQLFETRREYFGRRRYERVSPYGVVEVPARQLFVVLMALGFLGAPLESFERLVFVVVASLKLFLEWSTVRAARADEGTNRFVDRIASWFAGPTEDAAVDDREEAVHVPGTAPDARFRPVPTVVAADGLLRALRRTVFYLPFLTVAWFVALFVVVARVDSPVVFWLGVVGYLLLLVVIVGVQTVRHYLARGTLEYQRREDRLVAYDRLLAEPQWVARIDALRNPRVANDHLTDRLLGTRTLRVTTGWGSTETDRTLGPLAEPDRAVEAFELGLSTTDLEPLHRPIAAAAVGLGVGIVIAILGLQVVPGLSTETRFNAVMALPFLLVVPLLLWELAVPDEASDA
ncbi:hypothetical protein SAMN05444422_10590 [Halobiforma haloterrestris]|uniref:Uncharacterized protein n=1 Tax=Natronobacterium haloterrestre TaxID=148448 RepID=A0A1I1H393_NATHA|nr:DUF6498-containing protein [Halobiforma haloterrestris]SFC16578.1 hypothetical protein SAMN05444422_10590 [Halobiforma haloterrestris]